MNVRALLIAVLLAAPASAPSQRKQEYKTVKVELKESDSELLWKGRFAHCDYGFYVLLPREFVAHGSLPPFPDHGFLVSAENPATVQTLSAEDERVIFVNAEYNSLEFASLDAAVDWDIEAAREGKNEFQVVARRKIRLNGVSAVEFKLKYSTPAGEAVEEAITTIRAGIVYEIGLRTTTANYAADKAVLERVKAGFRFWRIHYC